jgi:hypothetical protein
VRVLARTTLYLNAVKNLGSVKSTLEERQSKNAADVSTWQKTVDKQREYVVKYGNELSTYMMSEDVRKLLSASF